MSYFREHLSADCVNGRWCLVQNKRIFKERVDHSETGEETLLSVSKHYGVKAYKELSDDEQYASIKPAESLIGYKRVKKNDLVMNIMRAQNGSYGIADRDGIVSPAYCIYEPIVDFSSSFIQYLYKTPEMINSFSANSYGIAEHRRRLYPEYFLRMFTVLPPREEQDQIVRFLDWKVSGVNKAIAIKRKEIAKLREMKINLIDAAVINGIRQSERIHNADIRWDIDYPKHWRVQRVRETFLFRKGLSITKANLEETGVAVINYGQVHSKKNSGVSLNPELIRYVNESYLLTNPSALVEKGDFIFADTSEDVAGCGNCAYIDWDESIFAGYHSIIAHPNGETNNKYFAYLFQSPTWRYQIRKKVNGVKVYSITQRMLKDAFILIPPEAEQNEIVVHLDRICQKIDALIDLENRKIKNLQDLKTSLISKTVTGKIDVRSILVPDFEYVEEETDSEEDDEQEETNDEEE